MKIHVLNKLIQIQLLIGSSLSLWLFVVNSATWRCDKPGALASQQSAPLPDPKSMAIHPPNPRAQLLSDTPDVWKDWTQKNGEASLNPLTKMVSFFVLGFCYTPWFLWFVVCSWFAPKKKSPPVSARSALPHKNLMSEPCLNRKSKGGKQQQVVLQT